MAYLHCSLDLSWGKFSLSETYISRRRHTTGCVLGVKNKRRCQLSTSASGHLNPSTVVVLEARLATIWRHLTLATVLWLWGAQAVFGSRTKACGYPTEGCGHYTCPMCSPHSSTAALGTQLSCLRIYVKNSKLFFVGDSNLCIFRGAPGDLSRRPDFDSTYTPLHCHYREPPSAELTAGCFPCHALLCVVRAVSYVHTRSSPGFASYLCDKYLLYSLERKKSLTWV